MKNRRRDSGSSAICTKVPTKKDSLDTKKGLKSLKRSSSGDLKFTDSNNKATSAVKNVPNTSGVHKPPKMPKPAKNIN